MTSVVLWNLSPCREIEFMHPTGSPPPFSPVQIVSGSSGPPPPFSGFRNAVGTCAAGATSTKRRPRGGRRFSCGSEGTRARAAPPSRWSRASPAAACTCTAPCCVWMRPQRRPHCKIAPVVGSVDVEPRRRQCGSARPRVRTDPVSLDLGPDHGEQISLARVARRIERTVRAEVLDA